MRTPAIATVLLALAFPALAQSPTLAPLNPKTEELWAKPPFGDDPQSLRAALANSCAVFAKKSPSQNVSLDARFGTYGQWQSVCKQALAQPDDKIETYLTSTLAPLTLADTGKFTGYYKPVVEGSLTHHGPYQTPMLAKPADLVKCNGATGQQLPNGSCKNPYPNRAEIERNLDKYKVLLWLKDSIDAYFIHIQGSALVELEDGTTEYLSFAAKNGWPYVAIGKVLRDKGELKGDITADKIRQWLALHPARRDEILQQNPSYIFFKKGDGSPMGAMGVPLVAGRSLAVDRSFIPLGLPVLLDTTTTHDAKPWHRVMLAQDIGSAITGGARGDIFFGLGPFAGDYAGDQNSTGTLQVLVPKAALKQAQTISDTLIPMAAVTPTIVISTTAVSQNNMPAAVSDTLPSISVAGTTDVSSNLVAAVTSPTLPISESTVEALAQTAATIEPAAGPATTPAAAPQPLATQTIKTATRFVADHISAPDPTATDM